MDRILRPGDGCAEELQRSTRPAPAGSDAAVRRKDEALGLDPRAGTPNTEVNTVLRQWYRRTAYPPSGYPRMPVGE